MSRYTEALTKVHEAIEAEKAAGEYQITSIDRKFYHDVRNILNDQKTNSIEHTNLESAILELYRTRKGKIMRLTIPSDGYSWKNLTIEESDFCRTIENASRRLSKRVRTGFDEDRSE